MPAPAPTILWCPYCRKSHREDIVAARSDDGNCPDCHNDTLEPTDAGGAETE